MRWFSKTDKSFFLATVVPNGEGARVDSGPYPVRATPPWRMVTVSGTGVTMA